MDVTIFTLQISSTSISDQEIRAFFAILFGAIIGSFVSYWLLRKRENDKEYELIYKIRNLLNEEFNRLLELTIKSTDHTKELKTKLTDIQYLNQVFSDEKILHKAIMDTILPLKFAYRRTLESSGTLIKLEKREIQLVQTVYDYLENTNKNSETTGLGHTQYVDSYFPNMNDVAKKYWIDNILIDYVDTTIKMCKETYNALYSLSEIKWMTLPMQSNEYTDTIIPGRRIVVDSHGSWEWVN